MVRIAVPVKSPDVMEVFEHFGRCESFALIDDSISVVSVDPSSGKKPAAFLAEQKVEVVLAGLIGPCEYEVLLDRGVKVFKGAEGTVDDAIEAYKAGKLSEVQKSRYSL